MALINVFKIETNQYDDFIKRLRDLCGDPHKKDISIFGLNLHTELYVKNDKIPQKVGWKWVLQDFSVNAIEKEKQAWSVMVSKVGEAYYALTFGNAFFHVDKFSDKDFAFSIGRKFDYKQIKSTAQANPDSNRNKTIVSYLKNDKFEYTSGESFIKIKGNVKLAEDFSLFKENIEIGSSIKFDVNEPTVEKCLEILLYLNDLAQKDDVTRIPIFIKVKDDRLKEELDKHLADDIKHGNFTMSFSDFDIIGTQESFYSVSQGYTIRYKHKSKVVDALTEDNLKAFCQEKELDYDDVVLSLYIVVKANDFEEERSIKELIDYTDEERRCVLLKGEWYQYNNDYLAELDESMDEIDVLEDQRFNWTDERYDAFLYQKYAEEKDSDQYKGMSETAINEFLRRKYYPERAYNEYMAATHGYLLLDRKLIPIENHKVEVADLYSNGCMIAVKMGDSSSKLCYAVDQIEASAKVVKKNKIKFEQPIERVAVLFVLDRKNALPKENGKVALRHLKMLVLKNRLNEWKREMRLLGFIPQVYIGYRT